MITMAVDGDHKMIHGHSIEWTASRLKQSRSQARRTRGNCFLGVDADLRIDGFRLPKLLSRKVGQ